MTATPTTRYPCPCIATGGRVPCTKHPVSLKDPLTVRQPAACDAEHYILGFDCPRPAMWLHIVHVNTLETHAPTDGPACQVAVRFYCSEHACDAMAADAIDPEVTLATYKPLGV